VKPTLRRDNLFSPKWVKLLLVKTHQEYQLEAQLAIAQQGLHQTLIRKNAYAKEQKNTVLYAEADLQTARRARGA
jgi:hypothetical protein